MSKVKNKQISKIIDIEDLRVMEDLCRIMDSNKTEDIVYLDMGPLYGYASWFLLGTGLSSIHLKKVSTEIIHYLKMHNHYLTVLPGQADYESGWVIIDCGDIICHLFLKETRELYNLEDLWSKAPKTVFNG